ncbi:hypothetical protein LWC34_30215 [Kibdelosporangium philippinense]|uniref:Uncharacterized protein n=1 Tax=Kibdelosporangium philippinense TaxID=211113 RepID=A0ABS8ZGY0_9PSEU|nr:hypothetical protein [Kibdelosporangium philippinense]MCE7007071.1 hypothetical protein [Kibdelosporangium philippinense]
MTATTTARPHGEPTYNSLDTARDTFALLVTGPDPLSLNGARFPGLPNRDLALDEVRDLLLTRECPQTTWDAVWAHLIMRSRADGASWTVGAVGVALPALTSVAARLTRRCPGDPADLHAEVLRGFLDGLTRVDLTRPQIMVRLWWAAYRAGYAVVTDALAEKTRSLEGFWSRPPIPPWGHPDIVLARAVAEGVLTATEADLIGMTRLESVPISQWAADHQIGDWAAYKARRRAELRLAAYLRDGMADTDPDDPLTDRVAAAMTLHRPRTASSTPDKQSRNVTERRRAHTGKSVPVVSKTDPDSGLQERGELPRTTTSLEVRPCA